MTASGGSYTACVAAAFFFGLIHLTGVDTTFHVAAAACLVESAVLSSQVFSGGWSASGVVGVVWWVWLHPATNVAANNRNLGFRIMLGTITGSCGNRNGVRATLCGADRLICPLCPLAGRRSVQTWEVRTTSKIILGSSHARQPPDDRFINVCVLQRICLPLGKPMVKFFVPPVGGGFIEG